MDLLASLVVSGLLWQGGTEIAVGGGERGPWRQNESRYDYVDDPAVAIDGRGEVAVAWVDQARKDVFFQRSGRTINVSRTSGTFSWLPRLITSQGRHEVFHLLWQEIIFSGGSHGARSSMRARPMMARRSPRRSTSPTRRWRGRGGEQQLPRRQAQPGLAASR